MKKKIIITISIIIALLIAFVFIYLFTGNYPASKEAKNYLVSDDQVSIEKIDNGYFFNGKGDQIAIVFYPGAKVDYEAYSMLMYDLAKSGYDSFLLKMPFNIAFFGSNRADDVLELYDYQNYYVAGHSLGGVIANGYAKEHSDKIDGVINLASYPAEEIPDSLKYLLIYGSNDMVMYKEKYEEAKELMPKEFTEIVIDGGNHAGFALYGKQAKDGEATITNQEQIDRAVREIDSFIRNNI